MAPTLLPSFSAVLVVLVALMSRTAAEDRRRPLVLLASDRPKFFGGGKRRSDPPPAESGKSPDLLDEVAGGRYGGGQTILPSLGGPAEPSTTKLPRLFPDPEGASPADDHGFDDDLLTPPAAAAPPPPPLPPPPPPPPVEETELDRPGGWFLGEPTETPRPREMGLLEAIANLRHDEIHGAGPADEPVSWTASRPAAPAASALPFLDEPRAPFADLAPVEAWEHAPTATPAPEPAPEWRDLAPPPPPPVGEPDPTHAASVAAAWAPVDHVASDEDWELVAPPPPPPPASSVPDPAVAPATPIAFALPAAPEPFDLPPAPTAWAMPPAEAPRPVFDLPPAPLVDDLPPAPAEAPATPFIGAAPLPPPPPDLDADSWHSWQWQPEAPAAEVAPVAASFAPPPPPPPPFAFDEPPAPTAFDEPAPVTPVDEPAPVPAFDEPAPAEPFDEPATFAAFDEPAPPEEPVSFSWALPPAATSTTLGPSTAAPRFAFGSLEDFGAPAPTPAAELESGVAPADSSVVPTGTADGGSWSDIFDIFGSEDGPADAAADEPLAEEPVAPWAATSNDDAATADADDGLDEIEIEVEVEAEIEAEVWDPAATADEGPRTDDDGVEVRWASTLLDRLRSAVAIPAEPAEAIEEFRLRFARGLRLRLTEEQVVQYLAQGVHLLAPDAETQVLLASDSEALDHRADAGAGVRAGCDVEDADLCPAIVQGETLHFDDSTMLDACPHLTGRGAVACAASCIPLQPHGNVRGVVHVTTLRNAAMPGETVEAVERAAQQVSVRLVELRANRRAREERARESADAC